MDRVELCWVQFCEIGLCWVRLCWVGVGYSWLSGVELKISNSLPTDLNNRHKKLHTSINVCTIEIFNISIFII